MYKIFGRAPEEALALLEDGADKDEIYAKTGQVVGVENVNFEVSEGDIFVVMGLSGSGKSTLVRMINGLIKPSAGEILVDGTNVAACNDEELRSVRRDKVAMVFQHFALFPHKTVAENVAFGLKIKGVPVAERRERALAVLDQVGLANRADSYPEELSGGMQQRVGLARGLAADPEILLMDEPFGALDPLIRRDMQTELLELQRSLKKTIVFITHDLHEALILGNRIAIMHNGRFVQVGTAEEIVGSPADDYVAAFTADVDRSRVFRAGSVAVEPHAVDLGTGAEEAARRMEELGLDALYVTQGGRIAGILTYRDAVGAARVGNGSLRDLIVEDFPSASPDVHLSDLYPMAQKGLPIALRDAKGRFTGVVPPQAVFAKLAAGAA
ncbi:glycine betaine/L-proline ABC transporter ATP-binding protein [Chelativorans sp. AA-79]|uniref:quaternary amine ABC transporter ATP-binding protein n=1 Tax=Chelativorans sp. AA-79 TaxID=3028735 RepID=UPI0023F87F19|nr:glycine betaine/L-proline ABC transporter ATP-binding protein [Chelativorans sp. AA-79]WEX07178.1 glycine betaine/L-proline ABC transporter ATP-binding protein [Chelativorans sp. AA-79]